MNKSMLLYVVAVVPLSGLTVLFFRLQWWPVAVVAALGVVAAVILVRRRAVAERTDDALRASGERDTRD